MTVKGRAKQQKKHAGVEVAITVKRARSTRPAAVESNKRTCRYYLTSGGPSTGGNLNFRYHSSQAFSVLSYEYDGKLWAYKKEYFSATPKKRSTSFQAYCPESMESCEEQRYSERFNALTSLYNAPFLPVSFESKAKSKKQVLLLMTVIHAAGVEAGALQKGDIAYAMYADQGQFCKFDSKPRVPVQTGRRHVLSDLSTPVKAGKLKAKLGAGRPSMPKWKARHVVEEYRQRPLSDSKTDTPAVRGGKNYERAHNGPRGRDGGRSLKTGASSSNTAQLALVETVIDQAIKLSSFKSLRVECLPPPQNMHSPLAESRQERLLKEHCHPFHASRYELGGKKNIDVFVVDFPEASSPIGFKAFGKEVLAPRFVKGTRRTSPRNLFRHDHKPTEMSRGKENTPVRFR